MRGVINRFAPIKFHWSVIALFAFIPAITFLTHGADCALIEYRFAVAALLYLSFIAHEMGHLVVGHIQGCRTYRVNIYVHSSSSVAFRHGLDLKSSVMINLAGPFTSAAIALLSLLLDQRDLPYVSEVFFINAAICLYNLIPAYPLDGGRILKSLLKSYTGNPELASVLSIRTSAIISAITLLIGVFCLSPVTVCGALMLAGSAWSSHIRHRKIWEKVDRFYK